MKPAILICILFFAFSAFAQEHSGTLVKADSPDFQSDGCTLFPDGKYLKCCVEHDRAYYMGGSIKERRRADERLFKCVSSTPGWYHKVIAPVIWFGVRVGGLPFLPTKFRWGFGQQKVKKASGYTGAPDRDPRQQ